MHLFWIILGYAPRQQTSFSIGFHCTVLYLYGEHTLENIYNLNFQRKATHHIESTPSLRWVGSIIIIILHGEEELR